jgi:hypothetical protein
MQLDVEGLAHSFIGEPFRYRDRFEDPFRPAVSMAQPSPEAPLGRTSTRHSWATEFFQCGGLKVIEQNAGLFTALHCALVPEVLQVREGLSLGHGTP